MRPTTISDRSADQRARDGRLAWIIVGCCAVTTLALVIALVMAVRAPLRAWAQTAASAPPRIIDRPADASDAPSALISAADAGQQRRGRARLDPPVASDGGRTGEAHKGRESREDEAHKGSSSGDGADDAGSPQEQRPDEDRDAVLRNQA